MRYFPTNKQNGEKTDVVRKQNTANQNVAQYMTTNWDVSIEK